MKRVISLLAAVFVIALSTVSAGAINYHSDVETVSGYVYLEELNTGTVVFDKNADERTYPASTTKIMTFVVVAEAVSDYDATMVKVTQDALTELDPESSVMGLQDHIGESFSVRDLLYGLMLPSGNDAALVLADYVGHGVNGFVDLMNRKATQIGCKDTHFTSPHGLHDPNHYSTARDMALITKYAMNKKDFMEISNTVSYTPEGFDSPIVTTNYMIDSSAHNGDYYYPNAKGIKTGYTDQAGRCLVSTAESGEYRYLCVALGAAYSFEEDINYAMLDTAALYDWAFEKLSYTTLYDTSNVCKSIDVEYVWGDKKLDLVPESDVRVILPEGYDEYLLSIDVTNVQSTATAPVSKGDPYGSVSIYYDDEFLCTANVVAAESIDRQSTNYTANSLIDWVRSHVIITIGIFVGAVVIILIIVDRVLMHKAMAEAIEEDRARAAQARGEYDDEDEE